jgi:GLE1-like protein
MQAYQQGCEWHLLRKRLRRQIFKVRCCQLLCQLQCARACSALVVLWLPQRVGLFGIHACCAIVRFSNRADAGLVRVCNAALEAVQKDSAYAAWREAQKELPKSKRATRKITQILTKEFNQLSGTMVAVNSRIANLGDFLDGLSDGPERKAFCLSLIETALNNAVEMMIETPKFGFPVAMVLTSMFARAPELSQLFRGMVKSTQYGCPLCVPQFTVQKIGSAAALSVEQWKQANGFKCDLKPATDSRLQQ